MTTDEGPTLEQRVDGLKVEMEEDVQLLGHNPRLIWLNGYMADEIRYAKAAGGTDLATVRTVEALAKELGATDEQMRFILPKRALRYIMSDEEFKLVRPEEPFEDEEFVFPS